MIVLGVGHACARKEHPGRGTSAILAGLEQSMLGGPCLGFSRVMFARTCLPWQGRGRVQKLALSSSSVRKENSSESLRLAVESPSHVIQSPLKLLPSCWVPRRVSPCMSPSQVVSQIPTTLGPLHISPMSGASSVWCRSQGLGA